MARLINDSGVLGDTMTVTANTVNQVSFDKIIEAIHVVQENLGIAGATAEEAATTIQGSISSMGSAWKNLVTGMADENQNLGELLDQFVDSVVTVGENLVPRIQQLLPRLADGITRLFETLSPLIPPIIENLLPALIQGAASLISGLVEALPGILSAISTAVLDVLADISGKAPGELQGLIDAFLNLAPAVAGVITAITVFRTIMTISTLIDAATKAMNAFKTAQEAATIAQAALNFVMNLNPFVLIATLIAGVVAALVVLWHTNEDVRNALKPIWETIKEIFRTAWETIKAVWSYAAPFFKSVWEAIKATFYVVAAVLGAFFQAAWETVKFIWSRATSYFETIWNTIKGIFSAVEAVFRGDFQGAWNAIVSIFSGWWNYFAGLFNQMVKAFSGVWDAFSGLGKLAIDALKSAISSAWSGLKNMVNSLWDSLFSSKTANVRINTSGTAVNGSHKTGLSYVPFDGYVAELHKGERVLTASEAKQYNNGSNFGNVYITVNAAKGQSEEKISQFVAEKFEFERQRRAAGLA